MTALEFSSSNVANNGLITGHCYDEWRIAEMMIVIHMTQRQLRIASAPIKQLGYRIYSIVSRGLYIFFIVPCGL